MGMDAITTLCETHADLPRRVARHLAHRYPVDAEDLEPAAWEGLHRAAVSWRPDGGRPFTWWAWRQITSTIIDGIREERTVPRSHWVRQRAITTAREAFTHEHGRAPAQHELREAAGLTQEQWDTWQAHHARLRPISLDAHPVDWPDMTNPGDGMAGWVRAATWCLPRQEAIVINALYWQDQPIAAVAADLGVTESRISQIRWSAIRRMGDAIRWHVLRDPGQPLTPARARRRDAYRRAVARLHAAAPTST